MFVVTEEVDLITKIFRWGVTESDPVFPLPILWSFSLLPGPQKAFIFRKNWTLV